MAESGQDSDRTEPATPFKLEEARKQGSVAKSLEINTLAMVAGGVITLLAFGEWCRRGLIAVSRRLFEVSGTLRVTPDAINTWLSEIATEGLMLLSPFFVILVLAAVLGNALQARPTFSFTPLKPDFTRINPATGLKRLLSGRTLFEAGKSILKLLMLGFAAYLALGELWRLGSHLPVLETSRLSLLTTASAQRVLLMMLIALLVIGIIDLRYTLWEFGRKMRMSRRELKDEYKRREGDPLIRSKRRELQRNLAKKLGSVAQVKDADVVITNPQHLAVALRYDRETMAAPKVVSKGAADVAQRIRDEAFRHGVPVIQDVRLARTLFKSTEIDGSIPEATFAAVAVVLRRVYSTRRKNSSRDAGDQQ